VTIISEAAWQTKECGHSGARTVLVWDPLVRLIHWSLAATILVNGFLTDEEGRVHEWIGYIAFGLVVIRVIWGVIGPRHARFSAFPPNPISAIRYLKAVLKGRKTVHLSHNPLGALMVYNIWAIVCVLAATGYMMGTRTFFGVEWVEDVHELCFDWLMFSIVLHICGVIIDTWRTGVPLVHSMLTGRKRIPKDRPIE